MLQQPEESQADIPSSLNYHLCLFQLLFIFQKCIVNLPSTDCPIYVNVVGLNLQCSFQINLMWSFKKGKINTCGEAANKNRDFAILNIFSALHFISFQFKKWRNLLKVKLEQPLKFLMNAFLLFKTFYFYIIIDPRELQKQYTEVPCTLHPLKGVPILSSPLAS